VFVQLVEQVQLQRSEGQVCRRAWIHAADHRHPENPSAKNTEHGYQVDDAFRSAQPRLFRLAAGLQYFVKGFDLPAHCMLVFPSSSTGQHYHTSPVQQDYIRPAGGVPEVRCGSGRLVSDRQPDAEWQAASAP
jgi:hypothetical protein